MKTLYLTVGISHLDIDKYSNVDSNSDCPDMVINRNHIREMLFGDLKTYKVKQSSEQKVNNVILNLINSAVANNQNILIAHTNLEKHTRDYYYNLVKDHGYNLKIVELFNTFEEAYKKDLKHSYSIGYQKLYTNYLKWLEYKQAYKYERIEGLKDIIICDIDGTVAEMTNRSAFEWQKVNQDLPRTFIIDLIENYLKVHTNTEIIFLSGRDNECYDLTLDWIYTNFSIFKEKDIRLLMRSHKDNRKDNQVKTELFMNNIHKQYNVVAVFDDRPQMIRCWHELGLPNIIAVANPFIEF